MARGGNRPALEKANRRPVAESKARVLELVKQGNTVKDALAVIGRSVPAYEQWRRNDPEFRLAMDTIRQAATDQAREEAGASRDISFSEFSEKYLNAQVFPHGQNIIDLMEGRDPSWLHPAMTFERNEPDLLIVNMPPEHPAALSTPLFTSNRGWITLGDVTEDDWVVGPEGFPCPIVEVWTSPEPVPVFDVKFDSGDVIRTSADHKWNVYPVHAGDTDRGVVRQVSTETLIPGEHRIPVAPAWDGDDVELPVDPYLFGYWLGDGSHAASVFSVGFEDIDQFVEQLDGLGLSHRVGMDSRGRSHAVYVHGIRSALKATGMFENKHRHIPALYFTGSKRQRLALLQGLMDADGTITAKDSRARFVQHKHDLARDVYRLVASLGLKPHFKHYGEAYEVGFRTGNDPVFRLPRKAARQKPHNGTSKSAHRVVKSVTPAGTEMVRCISVLTNPNEYCIGDGMVLTRNAKSTTVTMNYVTYRIAMDPNVRIIVVSKTNTMARKFLYGIKTRLTSERFARMHAAYAPNGDFAKDAGSWTQDAIYVGGATSDEKDPTVFGTGVRGHIYGSRADLIVLDDVVDGTNAHDFEKQIEWIQSEVVSRISHSGSLLVVGTRLASKDLYLELRNEHRYPDERSPWSYLAMPAVLEFDDDPAKWETLWPRSNQPELGAKGADAEPDEDGLYPKWNGPRLAKKRARMQPRTWSMVYMQSQVSDDSVFDQAAVASTINGARMAGLMPAKMNAVRNGRGMDGLVMVAGLDPATSGHTAAVVIGLDLQNGKRYVLDTFNKSHTRPDEIRSLIKEWTSKYNIAEWRIEKNGFQGFLVHDREINDFCAMHGTLIQAHFTGNNKHDAEFGVAAMSMLFNGWEDRMALIELPSTHGSEATKALVEQLTTWSPEAHKKQKTDLVMALWFAELGCRDRVNSVSRFARTHAANPFLTPWDKAQQASYSMANLEMQGQFRPIGG